MKPKLYLAFVNGVLSKSGDRWHDTALLPDGAYIYYRVGTSEDWYYVIRGTATPINLADVPKELRLTLLLFN